MRSTLIVWLIWRGWDGPTDERSTLSEWISWCLRPINNKRQKKGKNKDKESKKRRLLFVFHKPRCLPYKPSTDMSPGQESWRATSCGWPVLHPWRTRRRIHHIWSVFSFVCEQAFFSLVQTLNESLTSTFWQTDGPTDQPSNRPTNRRTGGVIGKLHFQ